MSRHFSDLRRENTFRQVKEISASPRPLPTMEIIMLLRMGAPNLSQGTDPVATLNRYFLWFDIAHKTFKKTLPEAARADHFVDPSFMLSFLYLVQAYAALYVVVEGWQTIGLRDTVIDPLLTSPMVDFLRRIRNGAYHFQPKYFDDRVIEFVDCGIAANDWVDAVHAGFAAFFDNWNRNHRLDGTPRSH